MQLQGQRRVPVVLDSSYLLHERSSLIGIDVVPDYVAEVVGARAGFVGPDGPGDVCLGAHGGNGVFDLVSCQGRFWRVQIHV